VRIRPDVDGSAATVQKRKWPLTRLALPGTLAAAALLYWGLDYILEGLTHESTDDAFIEAHIVAVAPRISGQISSVHVSDNQLVKQGELLVEIDPRDYEMRLNQKRAAAQTTDANLKSVLSAYTLMKTKVDTAEAATGQARAEADASKAVAARAATDFERGRQLLAQGAISQQEFDHARAAARASEAKAKADEQKAVEEASKVVEAKAQLAATQALVDVAEAQVRQVQTDIHAAELDLSYTKIRAPCAGRVTRKAVEPGGYVQAGQALLSVVPGEVWVVANFKETQLAHMQPGQEAQIDIEAIPRQPLRGHVDSIQAGSGSRFSLLPPENAVGNFVKVVQRVPVKILFDEPLNSSRVVGPGMSVLPKVRVKDDPFPRWALALAAGLLAGGSAFGVVLAANRGNRRPRPAA
jgi:membrane fusion protein (multidrug efflux system)